MTLTLGVWQRHRGKPMINVVFTIVGILVMLIGGLILAYPVFKPEDERAGRRVKPRGKNDHIRLQKAINRIGELYFWTDRKIYTLGAIISILGGIFTILGVFLN